MALSRRQRRHLAAIERELRETDPGLAGLLGAFGRLTAAEQMPGHERLAARSCCSRFATAMLDWLAGAQWEGSMASPAAGTGAD